MQTALLSSPSDHQPSFSSLSVSSTSFSPSPLVTNYHDASRKYDVFLNFRGEDTRKNIMGHLRASLSEKQIETFVDDDRLERGQFISPQLLEAIENSICSVVILSPNYASSTWCLDELVKILDCMKTKGQFVIPIFYHVDPSDVRKQTGSFGEAMAKHEMNLNENLERVNNWRAALGELTNLAGLDIKNYRDEANFVRVIVEEVSRKLASKASSMIERDNNTAVETKYSLLRRLLYQFGSITYSLVGAIVAGLLFFLVVGPILGLFFFKIMVPIFHLIIGADDMRHPTSEGWLGSRF